MVKASGITDGAASSGGDQAQAPLTPPAGLSPRERLAAYVRAVGRGPKLARALTAAEAADALALILAGEADPHQIGALLMLLRYRGESPEEVTGFVQAARASAGIGAAPGAKGGGDGGAGDAVDLDWPSYGAGRTRGAPWFLLSALALAASGVRILMHGTNRFSAGPGIADALAAFSRAPAADLGEARRQIALAGFAYLPLAGLSPALDGLLNLRALLGVRSPLNTVARLLDPLDARAGIDGVFHPAYIGLHLAVAAALDRPGLLVLKGGGGEAERNPLKPAVAQVHRRGRSPYELALPALAPAGARPPAGDVAALLDLWREGRGPPAAAEIVIGTIALALLALDRAPDAAAADEQAKAIWARRPAARG